MRFMIRHDQKHKTKTTKYIKYVKTLKLEIKNGELEYYHRKQL